MVSSTLLPQLVDLSIGTPEVGAVNFNALHKLLHAIVKKLNISELEPEVEKAFSTPKDGSKLSLGLTQDVSEHQTLTSLEAKLSNLENDLKVFYPKIPSVKEMRELIKSGQPIADFWRLLALNKKVEGNTSGVQTAMDLIQEIFDTLKTLTADVKQVEKEQQANNVSNNLGKIEMEVENLRSSVGDLGVVKEFFGERISPPPVAADSSPASTVPKTQPPGMAATPPRVLHKNASSQHVIVASHGKDAKSESLPKLDDMVDKLNSLQELVNKYPTDADIVTWPGLTDALNGVSNNTPPVAAKKTASVKELPEKSMKELPAKSVKELPAKNVKELPAKRDTASQSKVVTAHATRSGPTDDFLSRLESLGAAEKRLDDLAEKVERLAEVFSKKEAVDKEAADKEALNKQTPMTALLPDKIVEQLDHLSSLASDFADIESLKAKMNDLEVLLSDMPQAHEEKLPVLGDKSRASLTTLPVSRQVSMGPLNGRKPSSLTAIESVKKPKLNLQHQHAAATSSQKKLTSMNRQAELRKSQEHIFQSKSNSVANSRHNFIPQNHAKLSSVTENSNQNSRKLMPQDSTPSAKSSLGFPIPEKNDIAGAKSDSKDKAELSSKSGLKNSDKPLTAYLRSKATNAKNVEPEKDGAIEENIVPVGTNGLDGKGHLTNDKSVTEISPFSSDQSKNYASGTESTLVATNREQITLATNNSKGNVMPAYNGGQSNNVISPNVAVPTGKYSSTKVGLNKLPEKVYANPDQSADSAPYNQSITQPTDDQLANGILDERVVTELSAPQVEEIDPTSQRHADVLLNQGQPENTLLSEKSKFESPASQIKPLNPLPQTQAKSVTLSQHQSGHVAPQIRSREPTDYIERHDLALQTGSSDPTSYMGSHDPASYMRTHDPAPQVGNRDPLSHMEGNDLASQVGSHNPGPQIGSHDPASQVESHDPVSQMERSDPVPQMGKSDPAPHMGSHDPGLHIGSRDPLPQMGSRVTAPQTQAENILSNTNKLASAIPDEQSIPKQLDSHSGKNSPDFQQVDDKFSNQSKLSHTTLVEQSIDERSMSQNKNMKQAPQIESGHKGKFSDLPISMRKSETEAHGKVMQKVKQSPSTLNSSHNLLPDAYMSSKTLHNGSPNNEHDEDYDESDNASMISQENLINNEINPATQEMAAPKESSQRKAPKQLKTIVASNQPSSRNPSQQPHLTEPNYTSSTDDDLGKYAHMSPSGNVHKRSMAGKSTVRSHKSIPKDLLSEVSEDGGSIADKAAVHTSAPDVTARFNRTIREVVHKDYMPEIRRLQKRLEKLEARPMQQMEVTESRLSRDSHMLGILDRLDALRDETNTRVQEMDLQLRTMLNQVPMDEDSIRRTHMAIGDLQAQLSALRALTLQLKSENDHSTLLLKEMKGEMERLDDMKVDQYTFESELDFKANISDIKQKVDKTHLEAITYELHKLIDDLLGKLVTLEDAWKKAHMKLESDVEQKINEEGLLKLKQDIEKKIKRLNHKIKEQQSLVHPTADEAAAMRRRLPFNCLSCDKPVAGYQFCIGDNFSLGKIGPSAARYSQSDINQLQKQALAPSPSKESISLCNLRKRNLKAYMVHLSKEHQPKVFITRSKTRTIAPAVADLYGKPRSCGGKHTVTQNKLQGQIVQPGKTQSLKDVFATEEFVAAGVLQQEEQVMLGADGRAYKSRTDTIKVDEELTQAIRNNKDPALPIVEEMKLPKQNQNYKQNSAIINTDFRVFAASKRSGNALRTSESVGHMNRLRSKESDELR